MKVGAMASSGEVTFNDAAMAVASAQSSSDAQASSGSSLPQGAVVGRMVAAIDGQAKSARRDMMSLSLIHI